MSEALCQCWHDKAAHDICHFDHNEYLCGCRLFTPPPTREPIRLTAEAEAAWQEFDEDNLLDPDGFAHIAFIAGFRAARLAGGPTLADARTPESEDTE